MAHLEKSIGTKSLHQVIDDLAVYPVEAFEFVRRGLDYTLGKLHGDDTPEQCRHATGQQLCHGLRELALIQWGMLAREVLARWNITSTYDFGRIVFAMVEAGQLRTTDGDSIEDFRSVYDFRTAFEASYRIESKV